MTRITETTASPALLTFSRYCAPTALAGLMGCTKLEAAETLAAVPGMAHRTEGSVCTGRWHRWLREELGLVQVDTERSREEREAICEERHGAGWVWYASTWDTNVMYPTVAQWLRANPDAEGILAVEGHTLYVKDGEVAADTLRTKSMRRRVLTAHLIPSTITKEN